MLRRAFFLCMIFLLPFQMSWAVAGVYCEHESGTAARHFGHHDDGHSFSGHEQSGSKKASADCQLHTHAAYQGVPAIVTVVSALSVACALNATAPQLSPHGIVSRPERPKWFATV